jgi:hypothetical protein
LKLALVWQGPGPSYRRPAPSACPVPREKAARPPAAAPRDRLPARATVELAAQVVPREMCRPAVAVTRDSALLEKAGSPRARRHCRRESPAGSYPNLFLRGRAFPELVEGAAEQPRAGPGEAAAAEQPRAGPGEAAAEQPRAGPGEAAAAEQPRARPEEAAAEQPRAGPGEAAAAEQPRARPEEAAAEQRQGRSNHLPVPAAPTLQA